MFFCNFKSLTLAICLLFLSGLASVNAHADYPTWSGLSPKNELFIIQLNRHSISQSMKMPNTDIKSQVSLFVAPYYLHHWKIDRSMIDSVEFSARLPAKNQTSKVYEISYPKSISSFVIGSCSHQLADQNDMTTLWSSVYATNPSVIILGGDNIYADYYLNYKLVQNRDNLARAFVHGLEKIPLYHSDKLIPLLSIWDDHDYGMRDGNKTFHLKQDALAIFQMVYSPWAKPNKDALYQNYTEINPKYSLLILDARSLRDPSGGKEHLGQGQLSWLKHELSQLKKKRALIVKGDQFFGAYHPFESYEKDHLDEFKQFLKMVGTFTPIPILITGDRHLAEHQIVKIDKSEFHEFTSSPLHAKVFPKSPEAKAKDNIPARLWVEDTQYNFMKFNLLDKLHVEAFSSKGQKLYDYQE